MPKYPKTRRSEYISSETPQNKHTYFTNDMMTHIRRKPLYKMSAAERTWATADTAAEFIKPVNKFDVYKVTVKNTPKEIIKKDKRKKNTEKDENQEECHLTSSQEDASNISCDENAPMEDNVKEKKKKDKKKKSKKKNKETDNNSDCSSSKTSEQILESNGNEELSEKTKKLKKKKLEPKETQNDDNESTNKSSSGRIDNDSDDEELDMEEYGDIVKKVKSIICNRKVISSSSDEDIEQPISSPKQNNQDSCLKNNEEEIISSSDDEVIEVIEVEDHDQSQESDIEIIDLNPDNDGESNLDGSNNEENYDFENEDLNALSIKYNGNNMDYVFVNGFMVLKADGECLKKLRSLMFEDKVPMGDYNEAIELAVSNGNKLIDPMTKIVCINCRQYGHYSFGCTYDPAEDNGDFVITPVVHSKKKRFVSKKNKSSKKRKRFNK